VTVSDNSVGTVDSRAIWVTTSAAMGTIAAGPRPDCARPDRSTA
jgi:hypothetical protein